VGGLDDLLHLVEVSRVLDRNQMSNSCCGLADGKFLPVLRVPEVVAMAKPEERRRPVAAILVHVGGIQAVVRLKIKTEVILVASFIPHAPFA